MRLDAGFYIYNEFMKIKSCTYDNLGKTILIKSVAPPIVKDFCFPNGSASLDGYGDIVQSLGGYN